MIRCWAVCRIATRRAIVVIATTVIQPLPVAGVVPEGGVITDGVGEGLTGRISALGAAAEEAEALDTGLDEGEAEALAELEVFGLPVAT